MCCLAWVKLQVPNQALNHPRSESFVTVVSQKVKPHLITIPGQPTHESGTFHKLQMASLLLSVFLQMLPLRCISVSQTLVLFSSMNWVSTTNAESALTSFLPHVKVSSALEVQDLSCDPGMLSQHPRQGSWLHGHKKYTGGFLVMFCHAECHQGNVCCHSLSHSGSK